jgi:hypothetical protein
MSTRTSLLLPNPVSYLDYISRVILDSYEQGNELNIEVKPTTEVARLLVNQEGYLVITENK